MSGATCATCSWWGPDNVCRNSRSVRDPSPPEAGCCRATWYCSEHPGRKLPDVHDVAVRLMAGQGYAISEAFDEAERVLAEAKRRQGGER